MSLKEGFLISVVRASYILDRYSNLTKDNINDILNYCLEKDISGMYYDIIEPYKRLIQFKHSKELGINPSDIKFLIIMCATHKKEFISEFDEFTSESDKLLLSLIDKEKLNKEISEICKNDKDIGELSLEDIYGRSEKFDNFIDKYNKVNFEIGDPDRENPI